MKYLLAFLLFLGVSAPAQANWNVAESDRFIVYSESRAADVKNFAEMLERFHRAMELESGRKIPVPSPSSRVSVYMVGSKSDLRKLHGRGNSNVAGFYIPRASGSVAFVPFIKIASGGTDFSFTVLLHEYAHHFLIASSRHAMPRWLSEGAAEYFASARFPRDGSIEIGLPNNNRARELSNAAEVSLRELLDHELYAKRKTNRYTAFYGRSWLLFHYLRFEPSRAGQLDRYWQAVANGAESMEAAEIVFGDLDVLEKELRSYNKQRRMAGMRFAAKDVAHGVVTVRELSDGVSAMMPVIMRSKRGVGEESAEEVVEQARAIAGRYPDDPGVLAALAEAEYDAGYDARAISAATNAIARDNGRKNAHVQHGLALFRMAEDADDQAAAYAAAMKPFQALNKLENDHPLPLIYYYRSFVRRGEMPSESARAALERAAVLAPFDHSLAMDTALMLAAEGQVDLATYMLGPVAANPHGGRRARAAEVLIQALKEAPDGKPFNTRLILDNMDDDTQ